jgi:hypothetical protein
MNIEKMAKLIASFCYKSKESDNDPEFAAQIFIENLVLPKEVDSYTEDKMEKYILQFLSKK